MRLWRTRIGECPCRSKIVAIIDSRDEPRRKSTDQPVSVQLSQRVNCKVERMLA